jgi:predicted AAA+ superfamily ATPase
MNQSNKLPPLDKEIHLRVPKDFEMNLARVAATYNMKKSTFCRIILMRELNNYSRNRLFA